MNPPHAEPLKERTLEEYLAEENITLEELLEKLPVKPVITK